MSNQAVPTKPPQAQLFPRGGLRGISSWLVSLILHATVLFVVGWFLQLEPPRRGIGERVAEVGIALKFGMGDATDYELGPSGQAEDSPQPKKPSQAELAAIAASTAAPDPTAVLSQPLTIIGPSSDSGSRGSLAAAIAGGTGGGGTSGLAGAGKARVPLFGIVGEGRKFVFVFDRSESMNWYGKRPLRACKAALLAALDHLDRVHQFQIVFYNQEPLVFNPTGTPGRLAFATDENKRRAQRFVESVRAYGGTRHKEALLMAIAMKPDVIFFLTDADEPRLNDTDLAEIRHRAAGITIHTIEFGYGPQKDPNNFLVRLARENAGQHTYVDISQLP